MNTPMLSNQSEALPSAVRQQVRESLSEHVLKEQNQQYRGTGGVSQGNHSHGFLPAFQDTRTGTIYLSRFANGRVAPIHILDGLPETLITRRTASGHVSKTLESVIAGFVCDGLFYTREQAAKAVNTV